MSNARLPEELLDDIVDLLHDSGDTLKSCSLVSKLWIPRARKYLFAAIKFTPEDLQLWKTTFPDPSTSPACYTKALLLKFPLTVAAADREGRGWISTFNRVVHFEVDALDVDLNWSSFTLSLAPLYGFSPAIKSLRLSFYTVPSWQIFNLIYSFPLLDDLAVTSTSALVGNSDFNDRTTAIQPLISPSFTGSLELRLGFQMEYVASRLLSRSGGLHFRKLRFTLREERDTSQITALVKECRFTLESLEVVSKLYSHMPMELIDLSKATRLKDMVFVYKFHLHWIVTTLRTITHNHRNLQRVSIIVPEVLYRSSLNSPDPADIIPAVGETIYQEWLEVDHLLAQLCETHSIHPEVLYNVPPSMDGTRARRLMESLFPELTARGLARLTERQ